MADEKCPIRAERFEDVILAAAGEEVDHIALLTPRQVIPAGPAAAAGFTPGDVITSINGQPVNSATALTNILDQHHPGESVMVGLGGRTASVTLGDGPPG